jgi:hypothetical protein
VLGGASRQGSRQGLEAARSMVLRRRKPPASPLAGACATHHTGAALTKLEAAIEGEHVSPGIHTGGHPLVVGAHSRRRARLPAALCRGGRQQAWAEGGAVAIRSCGGQEAKCKWIRRRRAAQPGPHAQTKVACTAGNNPCQRSTVGQPQTAAGNAPLGWWFSAPSIQASLATSASGK